MMTRFLMLLVLLSAAVPVAGQITVNTVGPGVIRAADLNANFTTLANNALNRTGGTITGNIVVNSGVTIDGVDISAVLGGTGTGTFDSLTITNNGAFGTLSVTGLLTSGVGTAAGSMVNTSVSKLINSTYLSTASGSTEVGSAFQIRSATANSSALTGLEGYVYVNHGGGSMGGIYGIVGQAEHAGVGTVASGSGGYFSYLNTASGTTTDAYGVRSSIATSSTGPITGAFGVNSSISSTLGDITNGYLFRGVATRTSGTFTTIYGLKLEYSGTFTTKYSLYSDDTSAIMSHAGPVTLGGPLSLSNDISPSVLGSGGSTNDWNPTGLSTASVIRILTTGAGHTVTGIVAPTINADGRILVLCHLGGGGTAFTFTAGATASADANELAGPTDISLTTDQCTTIMYDSTSTKWRVLGTANP